jgi:hypothetical protein
MPGRSDQLNFEILRQRRIRAICHCAVDADQDWNMKPVKLRPTKEFFDEFNRLAIAMLLRAMDNACLYGRTNLRPEDVPTLEALGLDRPEDLGVRVDGVADSK